MDNMRQGISVNVGDIDWEQAWHDYQDARTRPGGVEHWDKRAASYGSHSGSGEYERTFIERAGIRPGETVLDMGCGVGLLAIPLAQMGCHVVCADFSARMLEELDRKARQAGVRDLIESRRLAWDDDWVAAGILPNSVDVAISSRSMATYHLTDAMTKLDDVARRRVCATVASGRSPMRDERAFEAVGRTRGVVSDYVFVINILLAHGIYPEVSYVITHSLPGFASHEDAFARLSGMLGDDLSDVERDRLHRFLDEHYYENPAADEGRTFESDAEREVRWAFVAWGA